MTSDRDPVKEEGREGRGRRKEVRFVRVALREENKVAARVVCGWTGVDELCFGRKLSFLREKLARPETSSRP